MNMTHIITLIGILAFAVGSSLVPMLRAFVLEKAETHKTISDGLTGPYHWFEDAGFAALAVALGWLGFWLNGGATWLAWLVGLGVAGAMITDSFRNQVRKLTKWTDDECEQIHLHCAAISFVGALFLEMALAASAPHHKAILWFLVALYPASVYAMYRWQPAFTAWQEWTAAANIVVFLATWAAIN